MEELEKLVHELEKVDEESKIIKKLQEIEKEILNHYVIQIGRLTIKPLLIEMYYFKEGTFEDYSVHAAKYKTAQYAKERQSNNFNVLYIHKPLGDGVDICLSCGDYYLSVLIKNAFVNDVFKKQFEIAESICNPCNQCNNEPEKCIYKENNVLIRKSNSYQTEDKILFLPRKGLNSFYMSAPLAAISFESLPKEYSYSLFNTSSKQWMCAIKALQEGFTEKKAAEEYIKKENYPIGKLDEQYWKIANADWKKIKTDN